MIAETTDLPTKFAKIVVTDDRGRYVVPDLPKANYNVWVRGYGLVDSPKVQSAPGKTLNLTAVVAPNAARGGAVLSGRLLVLAARACRTRASSLAPAPTGNGISPNHEEPGGVAAQLEDRRLQGVSSAGQQGDARDSRRRSARFASSVAAWERRVQSGQAGGKMSGGLNSFGRQRVLQVFADWTDRIAAGEVPPAPPRPQGVERNVVITQWDWADPKAYLHDEVVDRPAQSDGQRQRPDLRRARAQRGLPAGPRSGAHTSPARSS